jgi:hypothetical protein
MAQVVEHLLLHITEFNPQYHQKREKKMKKILKFCSISLHTPIPPFRL